MTRTTTKEITLNAEDIRIAIFQWLKHKDELQDLHPQETYNVVGLNCDNWTASIKYNPEKPPQMNKDTYTPLEIDGKIVVVVNAPEKPNENEHWPMLAYIEALSDCTKYPTIEADAPYWKERIGQQVEVEIKSNCWNHDCECADIKDCYGMRIYAIPPQKDPLVNMLVTASVGTQSQHDTIQTHMDEYFKRWPSYKDRLTELEWYHLFLDFSDKLAIPPQQKQEDGDLWDEVFNDWESQTYKSVQTVKSYHNYLKQHYSLKRKL